MKKKEDLTQSFLRLIVLFMGVIWQSDLLSQEPAEVRVIKKNRRSCRWPNNYREYYFGLLTEDEKKIYREMLEWNTGETR